MPAHHFLVADCTCMPRAAPALALRRGTLSKGMHCSGGGAVWESLRPPERCGLVCCWSIHFQIFFCAFIHTYKEVCIQVNCLFILALLCIFSISVHLGSSANGKHWQMTGGRRQKEAFLCFLCISSTASALM